MNFIEELKWNIPKIFSKNYVGTYLKLRWDVGNTTSGRNFCCIVLEVFREKFWRLGDKVLSLPSDSKTNNQTEL